MSPVSWKDRLRYVFHHDVSRGTIALMGGLALLSFARGDKDILLAKE